MRVIQRAHLITYAFRVRCEIGVGRMGMVIQLATATLSIRMCTVFARFSRALVCVYVPVNAHGVAILFVCSSRAFKPTQVRLTEEDPCPLLTFFFLIVPSTLIWSLPNLLH